MKSYHHTENAGGLLVPFHSLEPGASAPRRPRDGPPTMVVLHYTACADLPRFLPETRTCNLIGEAMRRGRVDRIQAQEAMEIARAFQRENTGHWGTGRIPDAIAQAAIAARTDREACAHYYVASAPAQLRDDARDMMPIASSGLVVPVVEFVMPSRIAHHVGPLTGWTNRRSVGIEVCYPGAAPRLRGKSAFEEKEAAALWYGRRGWDVPDPWHAQVCLDGKARWFAPLPKEVVDVVVALVADLCEEYPTIGHVCSHWTFAPTKRIDPDPPLSVAHVATAAGSIVGRKLAITPPRR